MPFAFSDGVLCMIKELAIEYLVRLVDSPNKHTYNHIHCNIKEHANKMVWSTFYLVVSH